MAQHNYFGFTTPVTQYAPQPSAYAPQPAAYVPAGQTYAAPAARPAAQYPAYDAGHATAAYAYTPAPPAPAARPAVMTVAVTPQYQAVQVKPTYSSGYSASPRPVANVAASAIAKPAPASGYGYVTNTAYTTPAQPVTSHSNSVAPSSQNSLSTGSSYDAALYSAATNYYQQKQQSVNNAAASSWIKKEASNFTPFGQKKQGAGRGSFGFNKFNKKGPGIGMMQTHYCEVCKISCAGPQTYKEHLEGQRHKKKEAQMKAGNPITNMRAGQSQLKCDLCDVTCTGTDAYTAHIRGAKHQKTLNLHQRLGKPIPSSEPTIITAGDGNTTTECKSTKPVVLNNAKKVVAAPGIKFVGGTSLQSLGTGEVKEVPKPTANTSTTGTTGASVNNTEDVQDELLLPGEKAVQPVGHEYIEETFDGAGKLLTFFCKLCDCRFNDPNAKNMHMKGRRHRTNYKKKVDPDLVVEMKQNSKVKRLQADRERAKNIRDNLRRQRDEELAAVSEIRMLESDRFYPERGYNENFSDRIETSIDRHIMAKHATIYPTEEELQAIQIIVTACEKSLKLVSDTLHEQNGPAKTDDDGKEIRLMKGVMRVGDLAKGLLLHQNLNIELIVLCSEKPTKTLLTKLYELLPAKIKEVSDDAFTVELNVDDGSVIVKNTTEPKTKCTLLLTSPLMREEPPAAADADQSNPEPADILDKQKCIDALAALRHSKWFQARAGTIPSCVPLLRVLKELRSREEKFSAISCWAIELLLERCMSTAVSPMGPGDAMRRFFEALSSGICLPGGPGLSDPCEKEPSDAFGNINAQSREILTSYAQTCLRYIAFNQIIKILDMQPLPTNNDRQARKRPLTSTDDEVSDGKKEKQEETVPVAAP